MSGNPLYASPAWRLLRRRILARDNHVCLIALPGCRGTADTVDHIISPEDGGAELDEANLQSSCRSCNTAKRNQQVAARRRRRAAGYRKW
jgi:5-methylcytosine-specific restriction protein A